MFLHGLKLAWHLNRSATGTGLLAGRPFKKLLQALFSVSEFIPSMAKANLLTAIEGP